jgi:hypothetical protein
MVRRNDAQLRLFRGAQFAKNDGGGDGDIDRALGVAECADDSAHHIVGIGQRQQALRLTTPGPVIGPRFARTRWANTAGFLCE